MRVPWNHRQRRDTTGRCDRKIHLPSLRPQDIPQREDRVPLLQVLHSRRSSRGDVCQWELEPRQETGLYSEATFTD